jgi:hypothetical protein
MAWRTTQYTKKVRFDGRTVAQHRQSAWKTARKAGLDNQDAVSVSNALQAWLDWAGWTEAGGKYTGPDRARIAAFVQRELEAYVVVQG